MRGTIGDISINTGLFFFYFHFVFWFFSCLFCRLVIFTWTNQPEREREMKPERYIMKEDRMKKHPKCAPSSPTPASRENAFYCICEIAKKWIMIGGEWSVRNIWNPRRVFFGPLLLYHRGWKKVRNWSTQNWWDSFFFLQSEFLLWKKNKKMLRLFSFKTLRHLRRFLSFRLVHFFLFFLSFFHHQAHSLLLFSNPLVSYSAIAMTSILYYLDIFKSICL